MQGEGSEVRQQDAHLVTLRRASSSAVRCLDPASQASDSCLSFNCVVCACACVREIVCVRAARAHTLALAPLILPLPALPLSTPSLSGTHT